MSSPAAITHILVMEDEAVIRALLAKSLKRRGFEVSEAPDGGAAIEQFEKLPDETRHRCLLILDLMVPGGLGGRETLAELRKSYPDLKAIIASGIADDDALDEMREPGKTGILTKPYTVKDLDAAVQAMT